MGRVSMCGRLGSGRGLRALFQSRRGTTAVEFAIVGPVMLLLMFAIIEDALMLFTQAVLDSATQQASRQIMIGAINTSAGFQAALCADGSPLLNCSKLHFDVVSGSAFPASVTLPGSDGSFGTDNTFDPGGADQFVLVEVAYDQPYVTAWLSTLAGGGRVLLSTRAFRNEPFS